MPNAPQQPYRPSRCNYIYVCKVAADGTFLVGPDFWTAARTAVGIYVLTHGLGHTNYVVLPVVSGTYHAVPTVSASDAATITVQVYDTGALADLPFAIAVATTQQ